MIVEYKRKVVHEYTEITAKIACKTTITMPVYMKIITGTSTRTNWPLSDRIMTTMGMTLCPLSWYPLGGKTSSMNPAKCQRNLVERAGYCLRLLMERPDGVFSEPDKLSALFRRALRRDPKFVARIKAETPWLPDDVACRKFTGPLAWLGEVWQRAGKPPGRPFDPTRHWGIVTAMQMLRTTHTPIPAAGGEPMFDTESHEMRPARPGELIGTQRGHEPGLTFSEAVRVLEGEPFPPGPLPARHDGVTRPALTGEMLNAISQDLRKRLGYPASREEIIRSLQWARERRASPQARYAGTRVRVRDSGPRGRLLQ